MREKQFESILVIVTGFVGLYLWLERVEWLYAGLAIAISSLLSSWCRNKIVVLWHGLAQVLGAINSRILLTLVFYLLLTPIAVLRRMLSNEKRLDASQFKERKHCYTIEDFERPW